MTIEKIEIIAINVEDIESAKSLFSEILDIEFDEMELGVDVTIEAGRKDSVDPQPLGQQGTRVAIDRKGFIELIQTSPSMGRDGFRNIHFKVSNMDEAMERVRRKGVRVVADLKIGGLREVIFHPDDLHGIRMCFVEYKSSSLVEAMRGV